MAVAGPNEYQVSPFPIGQPIVIVPEEGSEAECEGEEFPSRIEDVLNEGLLVSMPMRRCALVDLPINSAVSAYYNRAGARYHFRGTVKASKENPFPVLLLSNIGRVVRLERRAHVRANAIIEPRHLAVMDEEQPDPKRKLGFVANLSAGGLGLVCRRPLAVGTLLDVSMDLPLSAGRLDCAAEVVRCKALVGGYHAQWQVGAALKDVSQKESDRISSFVLQQQQVLRRRGLM